MVECNSDNEEDWGDEGMDWEGSAPHYDIDDDDSQVNAKPTLKRMKISDVKPTVKKFLQDMLDLYEADTDTCIKIAMHYRWNREKMDAEWFEAKQDLEKRLGITFDESIVKQNPEVQDSCPEKNGGYCTICYEEFSSTDDSFALSCRHTFCSTCWTRNLCEKVESGCQGIDVQCMQAKCNLKVDHSVFEQFLAKKSKQLEQYWKWICKSYTDDNKTIKWCPILGCEYCYQKDIYASESEVKCECGGSFCFLCGIESHKPADCDIAAQWNKKNTAEQSNLTWIMANTKQCPQCKGSIEKNQGCNHMVCLSCKFDFCWICLGSWKEHGQSTGGYYKCNKFEEMEKDANYIKSQKKVDEAKHELQRYMFYYERYANHHKAEKHARELKPVIQQKIEMLHRLKQYPVQELQFLQDACVTVMQSRAVLKWTYAYGFYVMQTGKCDVKEKLQFEFWQTDLEKYCDNLHGMVEKNLDEFIDPNILDRSSFYRFKAKLVSLFEATKTFQQNIIVGLEEHRLQ